MSRFIILAAPRTGSNLLCSLLDSHPEIVCHHELFNPDGVFTSLPLRTEHNPFGTLEERDRDPIGFLDRVWASEDASATQCVGFKWTRGQNELVLRTLLADVGVKKLVLRRQNRIKTYVSERIAQQTQQWEVYDAERLLEPPRIAVDEVSLRDHIQMNEAFYADVEDSLGRLDQPYMNVTYEDLFTSQEQRRILEFLQVGLVGAPMRAVSVKQNATDLKRSIENFVELADQLAGSDLEAELLENKT